MIERPLFGSVQRGSPDSSQFISFSTLSMAMLLSGLPGLRPGKTNSPSLGSVFRIATTWRESGTRWGSVRVLRSLRRSGGITQVLRSRSISVHLAPITSPVRSPVNSVTSRALAAMPCRSPYGGQELRRLLVIKSSLPATSKLTDSFKPTVPQILPSSRVARHNDAVPVP